MTARFLGVPLVLPLWLVVFLGAAWVARGAGSRRFQVPLLWSWPFNVRLALLLFMVPVGMAQAGQFLDLWSWAKAVEHVTPFWPLLVRFVPAFARLVRVFLLTRPLVDVPAVAIPFP